MKKIVIFSAVLFALLVLFGCTQTTSTFSLDNNFTAKEGTKYIYSAKGLNLSVSNFTDSRCPVGVQCVWSGEQGVDVTLYLEGDPSLLLGKVHLGEITARTAIIDDVPNHNYEVELVSIDTDANTAVIIVRKLQNTVLNEKEWFAISPVQCLGNDWDEYYNYEEYKFYCPTGVCGIFQEPDLVTEKDKVYYWLDINYNIKVYDYASKQVSEVVCEACNCARGDQLAVLVDSNASALMTSLGWASLGKENAIACTLDARVCSDGSAVGREGPFCEFAACPSVDLSDTNIVIKQTDYPGFVINPTTKTITIDSNGKVIIETRTYNRELDKEEITLDTNVTITRADIEEIAQLALSSNFFDLNQERDIVTCIADAPTQGIELTVGNKHNEIVWIGAECDTVVTANARSIIEKINSSLVPKTAN